MTAICEWFALCDHEAAGTVAHPILGDVPTCERCATKLDLDLRRYEVARSDADIAGEVLRDVSAMFLGTPPEAAAPKRARRCPECKVWLPAHRATCSRGAQ